MEIKLSARGSRFSWWQYEPAIEVIVSNNNNNNNDGVNIDIILEPIHRNSPNRVFSFTKAEFDWLNKTSLNLLTKVHESNMNIAVSEMMIRCTCPLEVTVSNTSKRNIKVCRSVDGNYFTITKEQFEWITSTTQGLLAKLEEMKNAIKE